MVDPKHPRLGIVRQCALVSISRSSFYYEGKGESPLNLALMRLIDAQFSSGVAMTSCSTSRAIGR